jgi:hypothetical protein
MFLSCIKNGVDREIWFSNALRTLSLAGGAGTLIDILKCS